MLLIILLLNIPPDDDTRVILEADNGSNDDYINANYVTVRNNTNIVITLN